MAICQKKMKYFLNLPYNHLMMNYYLFKLICRDCNSDADHDYSAYALTEGKLIRSDTLLVLGFTYRNQEVT
jgi:hypothetical protein